MSNTLKRILSALLLISLCMACIFAGKNSTRLLILLIGSLTIDELSVHIFKRQRFSCLYLLSEALFFLPYIFLSYCLQDSFSTALWALSFNTIFALLLFNINLNKEMNFIPTYLKDLILSLLVLLPLLSLSLMIKKEDWILSLIFMASINISTDIGSWFFGTQFGKHPFYPTISPYKTIEGLVGGFLLAIIVGGSFLYFQYGRIFPLSFLFIFLSSSMTIIGDLFQSKLKRHAKIKDSSLLIPGHGGVYDRIDSFLFLIPFFIAGYHFINL